MPQVITLPLGETKTRGSIAKDIVAVAEKDYLHMLRGIAAQEVAAQKSIGNKPSNIIVDGSSYKPITEARRSIVVFFADPAAMIAAMQLVWTLLQANGRIVTGKTISQLQLYQQTGKNPPRKVQSVDPASVTRATDLYVAVPVAHVRKWQWLHRAGTRRLRKTRDKQKRSGEKVSMSVFETVARKARGKFRNMDIMPVYMNTPNLNIGGRIAITRMPAIKIRMKLRGAL